MGIYASNADGYPTGSPLVNSGVISASISGIRFVDTSYTLLANVQYWTAFVNQGVAVTFRNINQNYLLSSLGHDINTVAPMSYLSQANISGDLPTSFSSFSYGTGSSPAVFVQV